MGASRRECGSPGTDAIHPGAAVGATTKTTCSSGSRRYNHPLLAMPHDVTAPKFPIGTSPLVHPAAVDPTSSGFRMNSRPLDSNCAPCPLQSAGRPAQPSMKETFERPSPAGTAQLPTCSSRQGVRATESASGTSSCGAARSRAQWRGLTDGGTGPPDAWADSDEVGGAPPHPTREMHVANTRATTEYVLCFTTCTSARTVISTSRFECSYLILSASSAIGWTAA